MGIELVQGNLFEQSTVDELLGSIDADNKASGAGLGIVLYAPVYGDKDYKNNEYSAKFFAHRVLIPLYERLLPGGRMLLDLRHYDNNQIESSFEFFKKEHKAEVSLEKSFAERIVAIVTKPKEEE